MHRPLLLAAAATVVLGLVACDREVRITKKDAAPATASRDAYKAVTRLECPEAQGELTRISASPDGRACAYRGGDGAEVDLRLADGEAALTALEAELRALVPPPPPREGTPMVEVSANDDKDAHIRLPGMSIDADGDRAQVRIGGLVIDGEGDNADISVVKKDGGGVKIHANDDGAEIRDSRNGARGLRRTYILAQEKPAAGAYRLAGYEARGPKGGPLTVAVVRSKGEKDNDYVFKDMKALVARNAGR